MKHRSGGVVLAGGRSARMGVDKAGLEWHGSTLLRRVSALVARGVDGPVVVVAAGGQRLPELGSGIEVVRDEHEGQGPLEGLATGLAALAGRVETAYVSSTDVPFLHPGFVRAVVGALEESEADVALPVARGYRQPLAAAYRTRLAPVVRELLDAGRRAPSDLFAACRVLELEEATLPHLDSLTNVNEPGDYQAALMRPAPDVVIDGRRTRTWMARAGHDPEFPLVAGDEISLA